MMFSDVSVARMADKCDVKNGDLRSRPPPPEFRRRWLMNFNSGQCGEWVSYLQSHGHDCGKLRPVPPLQRNRFSVFWCSEENVEHSGRAKWVHVRIWRRYRRNRFSGNLPCHNLSGTFICSLLAGRWLQKSLDISENDYVRRWV